MWDTQPETGPKQHKKKRAAFLQLSDLQWCHWESNQGHKDFQSFADKVVYN